MAVKGSVRKAVLAYSGGLDTSVIVPWLRNNYGCEVVCFCANLGRKRSWKGWKRRRSLPEPHDATWRICGPSS